MKSKRSVSRVCAALVAAVVAGMIARGALSQTGKSEVKEEAGKKETPKTEVIQTAPKTGRGASDQNIKAGRRPNDSSAPQPLPESKGGRKQRGAVGGYLCDVVVDNWTPWWIDIYVDGIYLGTTNPGGGIVGLAVPGPTELYARADFTDGTFRFWGPVTVPCPQFGSYTWRLNP